MTTEHMSYHILILMMGQWIKTSKKKKIIVKNAENRE